MDCKNIKKNFFSRWLFEIIHIIHFEIWDLRSRDLKIFLGYDINYLSIWPFMRHPWILTRKASKLTLICFQLAGWWLCDCFQIGGWCHSPASWKQKNISYEAFLKGNQGWNFFFNIFAIHSSSRHEKCCQMSVRLFSLFRGSIYQQCTPINLWQDVMCILTACSSTVQRCNWIVLELLSGTNNCIRRSLLVYRASK